jgi:hypothetical protein
VLGDSTAFGRGVPGEAAFPERWEKALGPSYEVVNGAVCAYSARQSLDFFDRRLSDLRPDVLVVALAPDHLDPPRRPLAGFPRLKNFVREHSALGRAWMEGSYRKRLSGAGGGLHASERRPRRRAKRPARPAAAEAHPELIDAAARIVDKAKGVAEARGCKLALLYVPRLDRVNLEPEDLERREAFRRAAAAAGVTFWDATEAFGGSPVTEFLLSVHGGYLNERGHEAVARFLAARARRDGLI